MILKHNSHVCVHLQCHYVAKLLYNPECTSDSLLVARYVWPLVLPISFRVLFSLSPTFARYLIYNRVDMSVYEVFVLNDPFVIPVFIDFNMRLQRYKLP